MRYLVVVNIRRGHTVWTLRLSTMVVVVVPQPGFLYCLTKKLCFRPQSWRCVQLFCNMTTKKVLLYQILGKFAVLIIKIW